MRLQDGWRAAIRGGTRWNIRQLPPSRTRSCQFGTSPGKRGGVLPLGAGCTEFQQLDWFRAWPSRRDLGAGTWVPPMSQRKSGVYRGPSWRTFPLIPRRARLEHSSRYQKSWKNNLGRAGALSNTRVQGLILAAII